MNNPLQKFLLKQTRILPYARLILLATAVLALFGTLIAAQLGNSAASGATSAICVVFNSVKNIIFLLGLTLMLLGATLYAGGNIMPSQSRGSFQGYGMSMIIGGVVGVAIAVAAPFVLNLLVSAGGAGTASMFNSSSLGGSTNVASSVVSTCAQYTGGI